MPTLMGSNLFGPRDTPILRDARPLGDKADNNASNRDDEPASRVPVAVDKFPFKLHAILADIEASEMSHIVSFQPHGRAFRVHKIGLFESQVLPKYVSTGSL